MVWRPDLREFLTKISGTPYPVEKLAKETIDAVEDNEGIVVVPARARVMWRAYPVDAVGVEGARAKPTEGGAEDEASAKLAPPPAADPGTADRREVGATVCEERGLGVVVAPPAVLVTPVPVIAVPVGRVTFVVDRLRRRDELRRRRDPLGRRRGANQKDSGEGGGRRHDHESLRQRSDDSVHGSLTCSTRHVGR